VSVELWGKKLKSLRKLTVLNSSSKKAPSP
jgi:hypothetical protein